MRKPKKNMPIWADPVSAPVIPQATQNPPQKSGAEDASEVETNVEPVSDMDWLKSKMKDDEALKDKRFFQDEEMEQKVAKQALFAPEPEVVVS
jgi:hypothetical protein